MDEDEVVVRLDCSKMGKAMHGSGRDEILEEMALSVQYHGKRWLGRFHS